jgi:hypothetical protein
MTLSHLEDGGLTGPTLPPPPADGHVINHIMACRNVGIAPTPNEHLQAAAAGAAKARVR